MMAVRHTQREVYLLLKTYYDIYIDYLKTYNIR